MDSYEASKMVFSRIQTLEPENASKIMGYLLIQDHGEKEMIRLAYGPETFLQNLILKAKTQLGLAVPTKSPLAPSTPSPPSPLNPISRPNPLSLLSSSSRITNNGFDFTNPSSPSSSAWHLSAAGFSDPRSLNNPKSPSSTSLLSYASVVTRTSTNNTSSGSACGSSACGPIDDYQLHEDYNRCFMNDAKTDDLFSPRLDLASAYDDLQKQNYSVPGMLYESEDVNSGFGWKPCLYFARGFCKNGSFCRFLHGDSSTSDGTSMVGSPNNNLNDLEQCQDLLRLKAAAQQQRMASASQFMTTSASFPYSQCMDLLTQQQIDTQRCRSAAAALMVGDEFQKFSRCRLEKNEFSAMNLNPGSRQIYLTFPADSTFREEDVSNYFSIYGPVQDVRIPFQQKRMFGFVTFLYPETVKMILGKGNPHFVCDSRVLVKPYKEKGKMLDKKQQHQYLDRGDYSICSSPTGLDCHGERMFYNTQEMLLAKKLEERANLRQAVELQGRRLMTLRLQDLKNQSYYGQQYQYHHGLPTESSIPSRVLSRTPHNQTSLFPPDGTHQQVLEEENGIPSATLQLEQEVNPAFNLNNGKEDESGKEYYSNAEESDIFESIEHILPDCLFASPKKSAGRDHTASMEANESTTTTTDSSSSSNGSPVLPSTSTLNVAPPESVFSNSPGFLLGMEPLECN